MVTELKKNSVKILCDWKIKEKKNIGYLLIQLPGFIFQDSRLSGGSVYWESHIRKFTV